MIIAARRKSSALFVENQQIGLQLPKVQELFAEAFIELQKDIGEESARAFQTASAAEDPLALLLDATAAPASHSAISRSFRRQTPGKNRRRQREGGDLDGGFIRETVLPERLRKLQNPNKLDGYASKYNKHSTAMPMKRPAAKSNSSATKPSNPYQRKQKTNMNVWNQVLDSNDGNNNNGKKKKAKTSWQDMEKEMINDITSGSNASSKTCMCGSTNVEINGNVASRNNESMTKGEVWGNKDRTETVVERCHCLACGKTWNEE